MLGEEGLYKELDSEDHPLVGSEGEMEGPQDLLAALIPKIMEMKETIEHEEAKEDIEHLILGSEGEQ